MPAKNPHPYFDDRGAVNWYTRFAEAVAVATQSGKYIFVEFGRFA